MTDKQTLTGLARRERRGSEKMGLGFENLQRMLPLVVETMMSDQEKTPQELALMTFAPDMAAMMMENAYCDMWGRTDIIDCRIRSLFTVSLMIGVGNVGNQFELDYHAPGAIYNGATLAELEAIIIHAAAYVGYPATGHAQYAIVDALLKHDMLKEPTPPTDAERRELTGSEKRAKAREVLTQIQPDSPLLNLTEDIDPTVFGAELDFMILENMYYDLWTRTDVFDHKTRCIVILGFIMGLGNVDALREHVQLAMRNGVTVSELEEFVYHAANYVGYISATSIRKAISESLALTPS